MGFLNYLLRLLMSDGSQPGVVADLTRAEASLPIQDGTTVLLPPDATMSAPARPMSEIAQERVAQLQQIDPDFNQVAFLNQASAAFQPAWQSQAGMTIAKLDTPTLMKVSVDGMQQQLTVRFTGLATAAGADASQAQTFTEFATFVRPAGSTTPKTVATGAPAKCPGCGAPTPPGALTCPYCNSPLTGTGGDWKLDHLSASAYT
jgi:hypothetical protein